MMKFNLKKIDPLDFIFQPQYMPGVGLFDE